MVTLLFIWIPLRWKYTYYFIYLILNPTLPIFIVVQDALVIADVMLIFADVVSLMVGLVTVHLAAVSQSETVTTRSASRKG